MKFNILERYLAKTLLLMIGITILMLLGISLIIKFVEEFRHVGQGDYSAGSALLYSLMMLPRDLENLLVPAMLLGSLVALGNLSSSNEIVAMQSLGYSRFKIGFATLKATLPIMIFGLILSQWVVPHSDKFAREFKAIAQSGGNVLPTINCCDKH